MMSRVWLLGVLCVGLLAIARAAAADGLRLVDGFEDAASWKVVTADGVSLTTSNEAGRTGKCIRLDYDFTRGSGYAIIRKEIGLEIPANYRFSYWIRGEGPSNTIEFKLVDPSGDNVWWLNQRDVHFPAEWTRVVIPRRRISFAWGPSAGAPLAKAQHLELVVTSSSGGKGTVWFDDLEFEGLPEVRAYSGTPTVKASSSEGGEPAVNAAGDVSWTSATSDATPWFEIDFGQVRDVGGIAIEWGQRFPRGYEVLLSADCQRFERGARVEGSNGGRDYVVLPDATARAIRITAGESSISVRGIRVLDSAVGDSRNELMRVVAQHAPRGRYPRYFTGEASFWTIVGADADDREALLNEDGAMEVDRLAFSLEPFVHTDRLVSWNEGETTHSLEAGCLPIPTVLRRAAGMELRVTAFADGAAGASALLAKYTLTNTSDQAQAGTLSLAIRPFQVNPPYQNLNITGGVAETHVIRKSGGEVLVDNRRVIPLVDADSFGATTFAGGEVVEYLERGEAPARESAEDPLGLASGVLSYTFSLKPGESKVVGVAVPFHATYAAVPAGKRLEWLDDRLEAAARGWKSALGDVVVELPPGNERIVESLHSNLAYILINRDGPGIQPGSRCYERTWIRDGALTSTAMLSMGLNQPVREFLDWFAPFQYADGKIPCVVDRRGPDPVPENDSHGEYIYAVWTYFAYTRDAGFLKTHWPHVRGAVGYIEQLRARTMTAEFSGPDVGAEKRSMFGLMPESISHEGYSAKPMHSYWDDFWTLRGLEDAAAIAGAIGATDEQRRINEIAVSFRKTLGESIRLAMERTRVEYVPGCAELGDFDATSTTVALFPCRAAGATPDGAIRRTFDKYWSFFQDRREGRLAWKDYTPYENRVVGSMVLLGDRERARQAMEFFLNDQRPQGWRQWAEVVRRLPREQAYIGDMPHTWVGSDFINSLRVMLAHPGMTEDTLVLGAGLPLEWIASKQGVRLKNLRTECGRVEYSIHRDEAATGLEVVASIAALERPPEKGVVLSLPEADRVKEVLVDGTATTFTVNGSSAEVRIGAGTHPMRVRVRYRE